MRSAASDEPPQIKIELVRRFRASPQRVFRALTEPAALRQWWCPPGWLPGEITVDLRVGGRYRIEMARNGSALSVAVSGEFLEVRPPECLVYTWRWEGAFPDMPPSLVRLELREAGSETLLTLRHQNFADPGTRHQHRSGWVSACNRLDRLLTPLERPRSALP